MSGAVRAVLALPIAIATEALFLTLKAIVERDAFSDGQHLVHYSAAGLLIFLPFTLIAWTLFLPVALLIDCARGWKLWVAAVIGVASGPLSFFVFGLCLWVTGKLAFSVHLSFPALWPAIMISTVATAAYLVLVERSGRTRIQQAT